MTNTESDSDAARQQLIQHRKKQVWLITLAMLAGGCLVTLLLLGLLYFLFTQVLTIA